MAYDGFLRTDAVWLGEVEGEVSWRYGGPLRLEGIGVNGAEVTYCYERDGVVTEFTSLEPIGVMAVSPKLADDGLPLV